MAEFWGLRGSRLAAAIWALAMFAIMSFSYNQAVVGGVLTNPLFNQQFPEMDVISTTGAKQKHNSTIQGRHERRQNDEGTVTLTWSAGTVVALYTLCGVFGALACTFYGDVLGRRKTIFLASGVQIVGEILMGTSFSLAQFVVARIVVGLGTGAILATISVWQSELAKAESRGQHVSAFGIFGGSGLVLALWLDFGASYSTSSFSWRFPLIAGALLSLVVMAFIFTLPESPRWLLKVGRVDEARHIIRLRYDADQHEDEVTDEIRDILASFELLGTGSLRAMFRMGPGRTFHRLCLAMSTQVVLQMAGVNVVAAYAGVIFEVYLRFTPTIAKILAASSQFAIILGSLVCSYTVDRFGRRKLMFTSAIGTTVCMACLTGLVSHPDSRAALNAAVFFVFAYYFVYCIGFLGIPFLYASEVAPAHLRGPICGISTATSWLFNFLVVEVTPIAITRIGWRYFIVYTVLNFSWLPLIFFFFPETNGRSLEEIDEIFTSSHSILDPVRVAKKLPRQQLTNFIQENVIADLKTANIMEHIESRLDNAPRPS